jgi:hypothetical protein
LENDVARLAFAGPRTGPPLRLLLKRDVYRRAVSNAANAKVLAIEHRWGIRWTKGRCYVPSPGLLAVVALIHANVHGLTGHDWSVQRPFRMCAYGEKNAFDP